MKVVPIENGAVEVIGFNISDFTKTQAIELRNILLKELVVVIKGQDTNTLNFAKLTHAIGGIANWNHLCWDIDGTFIGVPEVYPNPDTWDESKPFPVQRVSGEKKNGRWTGIFPLGKLDWHCNLGGPDRADGVIIQGIKGVKGTRTSWLNTSIALKEMPTDLYEKIHGRFATFIYDPLLWSNMDNPGQRDYAAGNKHQYKMWIEQENMGGTKGLYVYTPNSCTIDRDDGTLYNELQNYLFQEKFMYHHDWSVGDIVLSDQLLSLHKRRQEKDEVFEKRVLNRLTFRLSNTGNPSALVLKNRID